MLRVAAMLIAMLLLGVLAPSPASAKYASIVINAETGAVLHAVNPDTRHYPASLTKVMTLFLVFDALKAGTLTMDDEITISARAARQPASRLGLKAGDKVKLRDLVLGVIVKSANDAASAIGERLGGTERKFSYLMNEKARQLGMTNSSFRNASGLPNRRQLTTARDFAVLVRALQHQHPERYKLFSTRSFEWDGVSHDNHNRLLDRYDGTDGVKTGYIRASGFNLAASATRAGVRLIGVVLGTRSPRARDLNMMGLLERSFEKATQGRYIAYDYDRNLTVARDRRPVPPRKHVTRAKGARGAIRLARLTPPRRPPELARTSGEGSAPATDAALAPEPAVLNWEIQLGAFARIAPARLSASRAMLRLPSLLGHAHILVIPTRQNGATMYQARLRGLDQDRATRACELLKAKAMDCVTVAPPGPPPPSQADR